jgi:hypothetical protein
MDDTPRIHPDDDIPSFEPWVITLFTVFIPIGLAFVLPKLMWLLFGLGAVIFATSMVMLARQERAKQRVAKAYLSPRR